MKKVFLGLVDEKALENWEVIDKDDDSLKRLKPTHNPFLLQAFYTL